VGIRPTTWGHPAQPLMIETSASMET